MSAVAVPTPPRAAAPRSLVPILLASIVAGVTLISFGFERFELWAAALVFIAFGALVDTLGWWKSNRGLTVTLGVNLLLIFAYLWSLDESLHVTIQTTPAGFTATVGDTTVALQRPNHSVWIGLYSGGMMDYRVQPAGEAIQQTPTSLLDRIGQAFRLAEPKPAWANVQIVSPSGAVAVNSASQLLTYTGSWTVNPRGELEGSLGANALLRAPPSGTFTFSGDLLRPNGTQGLIVGVNGKLRGYLLAVRADRPDIFWFAWDRTQKVQSLTTSFLDLSSVSMLQRLLRIALGNIMAALLLLVLAVPVYLSLLGPLRLVAQEETGKADVAERWLRPRWLDLLAGVMALAALILTAVIARNLLQEIPHVQDSVAYLFQARTLALGSLSAPIPRLPSFFSEEFIPVYHGHWFGKYPPGWPILLAVGVLLHGAWLVNPILAAVNLTLIYLIGREVYGRGIAILAGFLALTSPFFLFLAGEYMAHGASLLFLSGFAYLIIRWVRRTESIALPQPDARRYLAPAGFLLGMDFMTRELDAVTFALPFAALLISRAVRQRLRAFGWFVVGALPPIAFLMFYNWHFMGNPLTSTYTAWWSFDRPGFHDEIGFGLAQGLWNTSLNLEYLIPHLFGWPFYLALGLAVLPFILGAANRWDTVLGASALCVILGYTFYWNPGVMYGPRYYYVAMPGLALLAARGLQELYHWPLRLPFAVRPDRLAAVLVPSVLLVFLLVFNLAVYLPAQIPIYRGYNFASAAPLHAVERSGIHHALIFVVSNPPGQWWSYGEVFSANSPTLDGDIVYAHDMGAKNARLMRLYPGRSYYRLDGTTLTRLRPGG